MALIRSGKAREPWQGSHMRKTMLACSSPHTVPSWGGGVSLCATHTGQHTSWRPVQPPWTLVQTVTSQNSSGSKYAADQAFLAVSVPLSSPHTTPRPNEGLDVPLPSFISNSGGNSNYLMSISFALSITQSPLHTFSHVTILTISRTRWFIEVVTGITPVPNPMAFSLRNLFDFSAASDTCNYLPPTSGSFLKCFLCMVSVTLCSCFSPDTPGCVCVCVRTRARALSNLISINDFNHCLCEWLPDFHLYP